MAYVRTLLEGRSGVRTSVEAGDSAGGGARNAELQLDLRGENLEALEQTAPVHH